MVTLRATDLGKAYRIYRRPIDSLKELVLRRPYADTFWALRHVNFDVARGGSLGIVGDNGAGKSTLLRLLAGSSEPTEGRVERIGRVSSILSLGAGFHPELTGFDNIRIGCAVMGLGPDETDAVLPRIVEFSELGDFLARPLRTYSSGMSLRLGFSVATVIDPDVLIVDEHLSVGDQHFRHKCMRRIMELRERGCSLVLCSHDLYSIGEVCERTLWLQDGRVSMAGPTEDVLRLYQDHVRQRDGASVAQPLRLDHRAAVAALENRILDVVLTGLEPDGSISTPAWLELRIVAQLTPAAARDGVHVGVVLVRNDAVWCYGVTSDEPGSSTVLSPLEDGNFGIVFAMNVQDLLSGHYTFTVALLDSGSPHVYDTKVGVAPLPIRHETKEVGLARFPHEWRAIRRDPEATSPRRSEP